MLYIYKYVKNTILQRQQLVFYVLYYKWHLNNYTHKKPSSYLLSLLRSNQSVSHSKHHMLIMDSVTTPGQILMS